MLLSSPSACWTDLLGNGYIFWQGEILNAKSLGLTESWGNLMWLASVRVVGEQRIQGALHPKSAIAPALRRHNLHSSSLKTGKKWIKLCIPFSPIPSARDWTTWGRNEGGDPGCCCPHWKNSLGNCKPLCCPFPLLLPCVVHLWLKAREQPSPWVLQF